MCVSVDVGQIRHPKYIPREDEMEEDLTVRALRILSSVRDPSQRIPSVFSARMCVVAFVSSIIGLFFCFRRQI